MPADQFSCKSGATPRHNPVSTAPTALCLEVDGCFYDLRKEKTVLLVNSIGILQFVVSTYGRVL